MIILQIVAGKKLKKMWAYYFVMQQFMLMLSFNIDMPANIELIFTTLRDTLELNALPKEDIKKALVSAPPV